ncbi:MAG: redoxin domain-containing protein [Bacteroidota bacterium]
MKTIFSAIVLFLTTIVFGQENKQVFSYVPDKPKIGDEITLIYNSGAPSAQLKNPTALKAQIMMYCNSEYARNNPFYIETPLTKDGALWKGSFTVKQAGANLFLVRFKGDDKIDDDSGNVWDVMLYGADGKTIKNAHLNKSDLFTYGEFYNFPHTKDPAGALQEATLEKQVHDENISARSVLWNLKMKGEDKDAALADIKKELDDAYQKYNTDQYAIRLFVYWYDHIGDTVTSKQIKEKELAANPKGKYALSERINAVGAEKDPDQKMKMLAQCRADFPDLKDKDVANYEQGIVRAYITAKKYDTAQNYIKTRKFENPSFYNAIAWPLIEKGEQLDLALAWAKKGVDLLEKPNPDDKPPYMSDDEYKEELKSERGTVLDTYGYGLMQKGQSDEAVKFLEESYALTKGEDADVATHYVSALVKADKMEKASEIASTCLKSGKASDELTAAYRTAYTKLHKSDEGFDAMVTDLRKPYLEKLRQDILQKRVKDKAEIDFTLKDLNGTSYTLASLKGKVVIVDFWATWCGPCKASFPLLQKVYNKYKDNASVQFLALNTWENAFKTYDAKLSNAKKFILDNKYTFPVLIDEGSVIDKYEVDGIPTQFIIDKRGNIGFKNVGYDGPQMVDQLSQQIEILLDESIGMK